MVNIAPSGMLISITVVKHGMVYWIYISSTDDIRGINWTLNDRRPNGSTTTVLPGDETLYITKLIYEEVYVMSLQLNPNSIQTTFTGSDLVVYLATADTFYGLFDWQNAMLSARERDAITKEFSIAVFGIIGILIIGFIQNAGPTRANIEDV